jgi:CBS domain containing-hemolysin-like protein
MFEFLFDPSVWVGLLTLILLEIVLGIDNLVFIAILADKLPPEQRDKARVVGLSLALVMRIGLLTMVSWLVTLTAPLIEWGSLSFSGRDLILMAGGLFLLFKGTTELHERLEGISHRSSNAEVYASFGVVVAQIVVLDAVFSLDAVITAVGIVNHLPIMIAAVVISIGVMLWASAPLTKFVNAHPTVVILCLSFLLMIGFSLLAEGLGFSVPKGYLYAAIGFSVLIESFNQVALRNATKHEARLPFRDRTAEKILALLGGQRTSHVAVAEAAVMVEDAGFAPAERQMVSGVLSLGERQIRSIMTPRHEMTWIDSSESLDNLREQLRESGRSMLPVCQGDLDHVQGVARAKDLLLAVEEGRDLKAVMREPLYVQGTTSVVRLIDILRRERGHLALVSDEYGAVIGLVTPMDVLEVIAGDIPDHDEQPDIQPSEDGAWHVLGHTDAQQLAAIIGLPALVSNEGEWTSLAGFLLNQLEVLPESGETLEVDGYRFTIEEADSKTIKRVHIARLPV